jgi:hypothetical protein
MNPANSTFNLFMDVNFTVTLIRKYFQLLEEPIDCLVAVNLLCLLVRRQKYASTFNFSGFTSESNSLFPIECFSNLYTRIFAPWINIVNTEGNRGVSFYSNIPRISWTFLIAYPKAKLGNNADKYIPFAKNSEYKLSEADVNLYESY